MSGRPYLPRPAEFKVKFGVGRHQLRLRDGAGVLFRYTDEEGDWYFLTQRSGHCTYPHTWAYPGGLVDPGEEPLLSAIRELDEETGVRASQLKGAQIVAVVEQVSESRTYSTFLVQLEEDFEAPLDGSHSYEVQDAAWFHEESIEEMRTGELRPKFMELWDRIHNAPEEATA